MAALADAGARACSLDVAAPAEGSDWIKADVRIEGSVDAAVAELERRYGRLDIVVRAAGVSFDAVVWKMPVEQWDRIHAINLRGAFLVLRHASPRLRQAGGGRISSDRSMDRAASSARRIRRARPADRPGAARPETGRFGIRVSVARPDGEDAAHRRCHASRPGHRRQRDRPARRLTSRVRSVPVRPAATRSRDRSSASTAGAHGLTLAGGPGGPGSPGARGFRIRRGSVTLTAASRDRLDPV
jgi:hypothetical protein